MERKHARRAENWLYRLRSFITWLQQAHDRVERRNRKERLLPCSGHSRAAADDENGTIGESREDGYPIHNSIFGLVEPEHKHA